MMKPMALVIAGSYSNIHPSSGFYTEVFRVMSRTEMFPKMCFPLTLSEWELSIQMQKAKVMIYK